MTLLEADQFYTAKLCGLFTKWAPTQAQYEFWVNRLQGIGKSEAEQALEVYVEVKTKTEDEPTWARFAEHLSKVIKKPVRNDGVDTTIWLIAQCYAHKLPVRIGQVMYGMYQGVREHTAKDSYQAELSKYKGGYWQTAVCYGHGGLRQARRVMIPRWVAAKNYFYNLGYRSNKPYDFGALDWWKPLDREYYLDECEQGYVSNPIEPASGDVIAKLSQRVVTTPSVNKTPHRQSCEGYEITF